MATAHDVLRAAYPAEIADKLVDAYREIENDFVLKRWRTSESAAGHFVEAARRLLECQLNGGKWTLFTEKLANFSETALRGYENATGDESFRLIIPRVLFAVYTIRNKRGAGHIAGSVSANVMDATMVLYAVKWVMAELIRLNSANLPIPEAQALVDQLVERELDVLWKHEGVTRVLDTSMTTPNKVLVHLYDQDHQTEDALRAAIEYERKGDFRKLLKKMHDGRLIERSTSTSVCTLTSKGRVAAEATIAASQSGSKRAKGGKK